MAYYYRGLLYLKKSDYQNARASFLCGEYQDTVWEKQDCNGDIALLPLLAGWSSYCDEDSVRGRDLVRTAIDKEPALASLVSMAASSLSSRPAWVRRRSARGNTRNCFHLRRRTMQRTVASGFTRPRLSLRTIPSASEMPRPRRRRRP